MGRKEGKSAMFKVEGARQQGVAGRPTSFKEDVAPLYLPPPHIPLSIYSFGLCREIERVDESGVKR